MATATTTRTRAASVEPVEPTVPVALRRSNDRKVTNHVMGSTDKPRVGIANAFGLPSGVTFSCQSQTDYCGSICYAGTLERLRPSVSALLLHNWSLLRDADRPTMVRLLTGMMNDFIADCVKRDAVPAFRIHWDGDMFSAEYTAAWSTVIRAFPNVKFWVYTRVAPSALFLHAQRHDNLSLYFSADRDNLTVAKTLAAKGIRIAYVGSTFADGKDQFPRAARCPENNSRKLPDGTQSFPLINSDGSACMRCGLCVNGRNDVLFSASKR